MNDNDSLGSWLLWWIALGVVALVVGLALVGMGGMG